MKAHSAVIPQSRAGSLMAGAEEQSRAPPLRRRKRARSELHDALPCDAELLRRLKFTNSHFGKRAERNHPVNRDVHRIAAGIDAANDERGEARKRERLHLPDEVAAMIEPEQEGTAPA